MKTWAEESKESDRPSQQQDVSKGSLSTSDQTDTQEHMLIIIGLKSGTPEKADRYAIKKLLGCSNSQNCPDGKFGRRSAALWNAIQGNPDYKIQNVSSPLGELNGWRKSGKWQEAWTGLGAIDDKGELKKIGDKARAAVKKSKPADKDKSLGKGEGAPKEIVKKASVKLSKDLLNLASAIQSEFKAGGTWASVALEGKEGFKYLKNYYPKQIAKAAVNLTTALTKFLFMPGRDTLADLQVAVDDIDAGKDLENIVKLVSNSRLPESESVNKALEVAKSPGTSLDQIRRQYVYFRKGV